MHKKENYYATINTTEKIIKIKLTIYGRMI